MQSLIHLVHTWLTGWQERVTQALQTADADLLITEDPWEHASGGSGLTRVMRGAFFEKAGVNFSHVQGPELPAAATRLRPHLAGAPFEAVGTSIVIHPKNPFVPTAHANLRFISVTQPSEKALGWFGGGFDLTPYYPFEEDAQHWHRCAKRACDSLHSEAYEHYKEACDSYFFLPHRNETRGIGGVFFDDLVEPNLKTVFGFTQALGLEFIDAYLPIVEKRKNIHYTPEQKAFQKQRRGRYVEFNLLYDRGTHFGLQSKGRTESILMSLPPEVSWDYAVSYPTGTPEAELLDFLKPRRYL